jgi:hypothetical protein
VIKPFDGLAELDHTNPFLVFLAVSTYRIRIETPTWCPVAISCAISWRARSTQVRPSPNSRAGQRVKGRPPSRVADIRWARTKSRALTSPIRTGQQTQVRSGPLLLLLLLPLVARDIYVHIFSQPRKPPFDISPFGAMDSASRTAN